MTAPTPPTTQGALERREAGLAWSLLLPTITIVSLVIVLPLLAIFWISFKPVGLADLRPVAPMIRESLRERDGDYRIEYRVRNSSQTKTVTGMGFTDEVPDGVTVLEVPANCDLTGTSLALISATWRAGSTNGCVYLWHSTVIRTLSNRSWKARKR